MKIALHDARAVAAKLCDLLRPACSRIEIAGSIRREKPAVSDIEIVAESEYGADPGLLFSTGRDISILELTLADLRRSDVIAEDPKLKRDGEKAKRFVYESIPVDLFIVTPPATWGMILVFRTGPREFGQKLVTKVTWGGVLPPQWTHQGGAIYGPDGQVPTDTEEDYFKALGLPCWLPRDRTLERLTNHLNERIRNAGSRPKTA